MSNGQKRQLVLGAGISGLAAARALQDRGLEPVVLESCPSAGGLTRSIRIGEFCFDYTGHLLHLARYGSPSGVPYANLKDDQWQRIERRSCCWIGGRLVAAPVQYHLGQLPGAMLSEAVRSYERRPKIGADASFRDFLVSGFGEYLAERFLVPLNEKTMATDVGRLSASAARRFFPHPDEAKVRAGLEANSLPPREYNSQFWYPKQGGIERLVEGLASGVREIRLLSEVSEIDLDRRRVRTAGGEEWKWERMFSSLPLAWLCRLTRDEQLMELAAGLTHSATICLNLGVRGPLAAELEGVQWIYVPDREIPFYRVGFYSNISRGVCPADCAAAYVEIGVDAEKGTLSVADVQDRAIEALDRLGWIRRDSIVCSAAQMMRCAYTHHTPQRDRAVARIIELLRRYDVHPIGRYGLWDHMSMEDSIASAIDAVGRDSSMRR